MPGRRRCPSPETNQAGGDEARQLCRRKIRSILVEDESDSWVDDRLTLRVDPPDPREETALKACTQIVEPRVGSLEPMQAAIDLAEDMVGSETSPVG